MRLMAEKRKFEAYDWEFAYQLEGAWDVGYAKWIFESFALADVEPVDLVKDEVGETVVAADAERTRIVAYAPYTWSMAFDVDLSGYIVSTINMDDRRVWHPPVRCGATSVVELPQHNHDMLVVADHRNRPFPAYWRSDARRSRPRSCASGAVARLRSLPLVFPFSVPNPGGQLPQVMERKGIRCHRPAATARSRAS
jgi:hypothetical protein